MTATLPALAIVNPAAGRGATHEIFRRAEHGIMDRLGCLDVLFTEHVGHGVELARSALQAGVQQILVAGGDGTISEVINGWLDPEGNPWNADATLYLLCGGTGGDLRRTLGIATTEDSMGALTSGRVLEMDVGVARFRDRDGANRQRFFVNVTSLGLSALVDQHVGRWSGLGARLAYTAATAEALLAWRNPRITLEIQGTSGAFQACLPAAVVAIANGQYFGGGMRIAPDARVDDGLFHITVLGDLRRREILGLAQAIRTGDHLAHRSVMSRAGTTVMATSDEDVQLDIDGEPMGRLPAQFELLPGVIQVGVP